MPETSEEQFKQLLYDLTPEEFEKFVAKIWSERGWNANVTQISGDSGIDIVATKESPFQQKQLIQVKRYGPKTTVSSPEIQQYASLHQQENNVDSVVVVTSSSFSKQATQLAEKLNVKLVNGKEVYKLIKSEGLFHILGDYSQDSRYKNNDVPQNPDTTLKGIQREEEHHSVFNQQSGPSVTVKWQSETGAKHPRTTQHNDSVYIGGSNNHFYNIECGAGVTQWSIELPDSVKRIAISGECLYVGCKDYTIYSINTNTGEGNWSFRCDGWVDALDVSDGIVCCRVHGYRYSELLAIDADSGEELWSFEDGAGARFGDVTIQGESVYYSSENELFSIDLSSGDIQWQLNNKDRSTTPQVHGDSIYVCSDENNYITSIDTNTRVKQWSYEAPGEIQSSRIIDGTVYISCAGTRNLVAVDHNNGRKRWSFSAKGSLELPPVVINKKINFSTDSHIYAVDPAEGDLIEEYEFEGRIYSMTADDNTMYVAEKNGELSAIEFHS